MEDFIPDRVIDRVILQVGRYHRYQSAFTSWRAWVYSSFAPSLVASITGLINRSWLALLLIPITFCLQILLAYYLSKEDTAAVILRDPFRASLYSIFYGSSPISMEPIQSKESSYWKDLQTKYLKLNESAIAKGLPNMDIERLMSIELISILRRNSYIAQYSKIRTRRSGSK